MGWNVFLESEDSEGHMQIAQTCATSAEENECAVSGPFDVTGLDAKTVAIGAECDAEEYAPGHTYTTCGRGNEFGHAVRAGLNFATITPADPTGPSSVTASGIPTEAQHGSITISGSATDTVAGLWTARSHAALSRGHFSCAIVLAKNLHAGRASLELFYPGNASYEDTHRHWTVPL